MMDESTSTEYVTNHSLYNTEPVMNRTIMNCTELDDYGKYIVNVSNKILIVYPWVIIIFGTISNILSIIILTRKKLRKSSTFFYLACLSAIDMLVLYTFCINFISYYHLSIDLQSKHVVLCKLFSFCIYFLPQYSAWTCAAVSIDRVIGVIFSIGRYASLAKRWNTPSRARYIVIIIGVCLFFINIQFLFYPNEYTKTLNKTQIVEDVNVIYCSPEYSTNQKLQKYYTNVWVHFDLSLNVLVPFAIMILSSFIIITRVRKNEKNLENQRKRSILQTSNFLVKSSNNGHCSTSEGSRKKSVAPNNSKARNISTMLVTNNFLFISLTLPIVVFLSIAPAITDEDECANRRAKLRLGKIICILLMNINCVINIFLYSIMASQFRRELISLFYEIVDLKLKFKKKSTQLNKLNLKKTNSILNLNQNDNTMTITYT
jgi:hypothetical protein